MTVPNVLREDLPHRRRAWPLALVAGGLLAIGCFSALFYGAVADLCWGVTHGWHVSYDDLSFRAPFGWRQEGGPGKQHALALRNVVRGVPIRRRPDRIVIHEAQNRFDAEEMAVRWQRLETQRMTPGDRLEPTPTDPFLQDHYRCSDVLRSRYGQVNVTCFDRNGRWIVSLRGEQRGIADVSTIMQRIGTSGTR